MQVQLSKALRTNGAVLYGTDTCEWTVAQKEEFGDSFQYIKFIEVCVLLFRDGIHLLASNFLLIHKQAPSNAFICSPF
jgi:hypothetical protein